MVRARLGEASALLGAAIGGLAAIGGAGAFAGAPAASWAVRPVTNTSGLPAAVTLDGVAGVRPGMTAAAVSHAWRTPVRLDVPIRPGCQTATISKGGMRGYALFENGRFAAVFFTAGARTPSGIAIGSSLGVLNRAYRGRLTSKPHAYQPGARYHFLTRRSRPHWQLRFDVSARSRVTRISFGNAAVRYVEGCA